MRVVYLAHPLGAKEPDRTENVKRAIRWYSYVAHHFPDVAIVADWILTAMVLDEEHRAQGIAMNFELMRTLLRRPMGTTELWLCGLNDGKPSPGMRQEAAWAYWREWPTRIFAGLEPPARRVEPEVWRPSLLPASGVPEDAP